MLGHLRLTGGQFAARMWLPWLGALVVTAAGLRLVQGRVTAGQVWDVLSLPVLAGLFGVAVALGTLDRAWSAPAAALGHLPGWATAGVAALATVVLNNLPA